MEHVERPFTSVSVSREVSAEIKRISAACKVSQMQVVALAVRAYANTAKIKRAIDRSSEPTVEVRA